MMKRSFVLAACVGLIGAPAMADYTVKGSFDCQAAMREDANEHYRQYNKWWLLGYFTARNYTAQKSAGNGIEDDTIYQMALTYCQANPGNDWDDAAIHVYDLLD